MWHDSPKYLLRKLKKTQNLKFLASPSLHLAINGQMQHFVYLIGVMIAAAMAIAAVIKSADVIVVVITTVDGTVDAMIISLVNHYDNVIRMSLKSLSPAQPALYSSR